METNVEKFANLDIRVGEILSAEVFEEAKKPAYILKIDFGKHIGIINLGDKQIGPIISQCLILGSTDSNGDVLLLKPSEGSMIGDKVS